MKTKKEICEWPGCCEPALCASGNVNGALVCSTHFEITNGKADDDLTVLERKIMESMWRRKDLEKIKPVASTLEDEPVTIPQGALVKLNPTLLK